MNKIWNKITGGSSSGIKENSQRRVKTDGKLFDTLQDKLKPMGLRIDTVTPYQLAVYNGGNVVGYYDTLTEIKNAINEGTVSEPHNL